jgi:hypothetical protein
MVFSLFYTLLTSLQRMFKSSQLGASSRLPTADDPLPLASQTVPVAQPQKILTVSLMNTRQELLPPPRPPPPFTDKYKQQFYKICGFHGGDYEEFSLLGYKKPARTSQETLRLRYRAQPLMLCKIWGFHGGDYEESRLLGC